MQIDPDRSRKGELKMYALMLEIRAFWDACAQVHGHPVPGGQLDLTDLDDIVVALDHALVSIRTLDLEVFEASDASAYTATRDDASSRPGRTVRALTAPRNNAVHHADVVDPDVASAAGPVPGTNDRFVINPRWKGRSDVPARMFQDDKGKHRAALATAYDDMCAGVPILDTLLDAFAFFEGLAPQLVRRLADGTHEGFPLTPLPIANRYRRLAPDWPTEADWGRDHRRKVQQQPPAAARTVLGALDTQAGLVLCGNMTRGHGTTAYTESLDQVLRDIDAGATYTFAAESGATGDATVVSHTLATATGPVTLASLTRLDGSARPWPGWWELCVDDAEYYARQRR